MAEMVCEPRLLALGDAAWTLQFGEAISAELNARVMGLAQRLALAAEQGLAWMAPVRDVVPTFRSLTVHFDPLTADAEALGGELLALARQGEQASRQGCRWVLPVCFDAEFAPDLPRLAQAKALSEAAVIEHLLATELRVYMIGFLPGFAYMGSLPPELEMPRLASPRQRVPQNSVAVAGQMCSVYPWESPGGWNLLGRTPVRLFDLQQAQPALLAAGDVLRWQAISRAEYDALWLQAERGQLPRDTFLQGPAA